MSNLMFERPVVSEELKRSTYECFNSSETIEKWYYNHCSDHQLGNLLLYVKMNNDDCCCYSMAKHIAQLKITQKNGSVINELN